jgi:methylenetetrahydrofolate dehydrogenase (NADP+)/methenyltetrahydrofolate cyclohydrolase
MKNKAAHEIGIYSEQHNLEASTSEKELLDLVDKLNQDEKIHGILVQLPLPDQIDEKKVLNRILPAKDVDGFHPVNLGKMVIGEPGFLPCTPYGVVQLLIHSGTKTEGAHVVVVGRSNIVGKPVANMLLQKQKNANATVTVCHSRTKDLPSVTRQADILIAAIGVPEFVTADMVKEGAVVIDVGVNRVDAPGTKRGYRLVGDVKFDEVSQKASAITPVPGGVGPMTITMLLYNTVQSAANTLKK